MPFGTQRGWMRYALPHPEILSYPLETNVVDSVVLNSSGVAPDQSGPYQWRRYLVAGTVLSKRADNTYEQYIGATDVAEGTVQTISFVGPPTPGGQYVLAVEAESTPEQGQTGALTYEGTSSDATAIADALEALPGIGAGNVTVTGPVAQSTGQDSEVYTVTFAASLGDIAAMTADPTQLTGPGNQDIVIQVTEQGASAGGAQEVAGILYDTVEFADGSELSDEPVAMLRRNVSFQASAIINFAAYQSAIMDALPTCEFI